MPRNLQPAAPSGVLPVSRFTSFQEELRFECFDNKYPDGSSDRAALMLNSRHFYRITTRVTGAQYTTLLSFITSHLTTPFYFYVPRERVPQFSPPDMTGSDPVGRYTVVFDGAWTDSLNLGRSDVSFNLREVA